MNQCESLSTRLGSTNLVGAPGRRMDEEYEYDVNLIKYHFNLSSLIVEGMDCPDDKKNSNRANKKDYGTQTRAPFILPVRLARYINCTEAPYDMIQRRFGNIERRISSSRAYACSAQVASTSPVKSAGPHSESATSGVCFRVLS